MGCVKIRQHTFPGLSETKTPMYSHKGPLSVLTTLWLHCNQRPALNKTSGWMDAIFTTRTSSQNEGCAGCGDTSTGLFQHPLHWDHWTQRVEKKSDIYCCRLPHKELKSDRRKGGCRPTDKGSLFADGDEWVDHNTFSGGLCIHRGGSSNDMTDSSTRLLHLHPLSSWIFHSAAML